MPLISIIIPIYNSEQFLFRCLDSVLAQTYSKWECILVDDGSLDKSEQICINYSKEDVRFQVIHQFNQGASVARNKGLEKAIGKYVVFVDSDDYLLPCFLENLLSSSTEENIMIVQKHINENGCGMMFSNEKLCYGIIGVRDFVLNGFLALSAPHSKMFSLNVIKKNNIRFPEGIRIGEDLIFIVRYLHFIKKVVISDKTGYIYVNNPQSIQHRLHAIETERNDYNKMRSEIFKLCKELDISSENQAIWRVLSPRLRKYIKTACLLSFTHARIELRTISVHDYNNYGKGMSGSWKWYFFKSLIKNQFFVLLILMVKIEFFFRSLR